MIVYEPCKVMQQVFVFLSLMYFPIVGLMNIQEVLKHSECTCPLVHSLYMSLWQNNEHI